ncbi:MAG TPA: glycosyltransferase family 4 protein [Candidatus Acidoferrales bacterium]|nr:glycosyltransferase family 4 protein [Candidatus Acidoferrales bacterium]
MKIVHISRTDLIGGAPRAAYRLHDGLRRLGHESSMLVAEKVTSDPNVKLYVPRNGLVHRLARTSRRLKLAMRRYAENLPDKRTYFSEDRTMYYREPLAQLPASDVLQLHWFADFVDYGALFEWLPAGKPVVWTLHDMAPFTGGCCYDLGCGKFVEQCGACPQLGSSTTADLSRQVFQHKRKYYAKLNPELFHIVSPSNWLGEEVGRSSLLARFPRSVIPYGLDTRIFQPRDRRIARDVLGVPQEAKVVLFLADAVNEYRKGFELLAASLAEIESIPNLFLLSVGRGVPAELGRFAHAHIANVSEDRLLSFVYSAADVYAAPSVADNLPNTLLESIACGTPVAAFDAGGMPDVVRPGVTGLLAPAGNARELAAAIFELLSNDAMRAQFSANCRRVAVAEYEIGIQPRRYAKLYEELLRRAGGHFPLEIAAPVSNEREIANAVAAAAASSSAT